jgi:hypothetical protein
MGVAAYVWDDEPPPPELSRALNYRSWGVADVMMLPAGMLPRMNTALSYYDAIQASKSAGNKLTEWANSNPQAWDLVTRVMKWRKEQKAG